MTALGKGVGPPWSQSAGRAGSPSAAYDRTHYATDNAQPPGRPGAGRGPPGPGSFPGNSGGGRRGRGKSGGSGQSPIQMVRAAIRTTTGKQDFTIPGFGTPVGAIFVMGQGQVDGVATDVYAFSFGVTDGINHWVSAGWSQHNSASSNTARRSAVDEVFMVLDTGSGVVDAEGNFDTWLPNGVRINVTVVGNPDARLLTVYLIGGQGIACEAQTFAPPAASATSTYSPGFKTHSLLVVQNSDFDDNGATQNLWRFGFGGLHGETITQCCSGNIDVDAQGLCDMQSRVTTNKIFTAETDANLSLSLGNITATSFDITSGSGDLTAVTFGSFAISLGSNGAAWSGVQDTPTGTGEHTFSGVGFRPAFGMMMPTMLTAVNSLKTNAEAGAYGLAGFMRDTEFCNSWASDDANTTMNNQSISNDQAIDMDADDGAAAFEATFVNFTPDGVILDFSVADGTIRKWPSLFMRA